MKAKGLQKLLSCKVATCLGKCGNMLEHVIHAVKASPIIERERGICWKKMRNRKKSEVAMVLPDVSKAVPGRERLQVSSDVGRPLSSLNTDCPDMSRHKLLKACAEDGHQRQMQLFVQDPNRFMDEFSQA